MPDTETREVLPDGRVIWRFTHDFGRPIDWDDFLTPEQRMRLAALDPRNWPATNLLYRAEFPTLADGEEASVTYTLEID